MPHSYICLFYDLCTYSSFDIELTFFTSLVHCKIDNQSRLQFTEVLPCHFCMHLIFF